MEEINTLNISTIVADFIIKKALSVKHKKFYWE